MSCLTAEARTVRDATFDVARRLGMTRIFANPGSTEISLLTDLPDDLEFVLGLHESAVVGMATGYAIGRGVPSLAIVHTTAGLGNAVGAIATARVNRAPIVIIVGQQDRRHLPSEPFLAGQLAGLAGDYPVWVDQPLRAQAVPGAVARAYHEAMTHEGAALVIVPMDDWATPAEPDEQQAVAAEVVRSRGVDDDAVARLVAFLDDGSSPAFVVGAGTDAPETWGSLVALAERIGAHVWQESFSSRAGFPQTHELFAGHLPADRIRLRSTLAPYDRVLSIGAPVFRQYPYIAGPFVEPGTRVAMVSRYAPEVHRSAVELAVLGDPGPICAALADRVERHEGRGLPARVEDPEPTAPRPGEPLRAAHVLAELAKRLPADTIVIEECPSNRPELLRRLPARRPLGALSPAMGGLGFALPAAIGLRMALPGRPVVAIVGDGSAMFGVQSLWSAGQYGSSPLFVVFRNGGYAIMDRLSEQHGGSAPWPTFDIDIASISATLGCPSRSVATLDDLVATLDEIVPTLAARTEPLLLETVVAPDETFVP